MPNQFDTRHSLNLFPIIFKLHVGLYAGNLTILDSVMKSVKGAGARGTLFPTFLHVWDYCVAYFMTDSLSVVSLMLVIILQVSVSNKITIIFNLFITKSICFCACDSFNTTLKTCENYSKILPESTHAGVTTLPFKDYNPNRDNIHNFPVRQRGWQQLKTKSLDLQCASSV